MILETYLNLSVRERSSHLDLNGLCQEGGPVNGRQLGKILDVEQTRNAVPVAICGNTNCGNPLHYAFTREFGESRKLITDAKKQRILQLIKNDHQGISIKLLAEKANCSRFLVRKTMEELGIEKPLIVTGRDGKLHNNSKNHVRKTRT